jgi:hypothetical protein
MGTNNVPINFIVRFTIGYGMKIILGGIVMISIYLVSYFLVYMLTPYLLIGEGGYSEAVEYGLIIIAAFAGGYVSKANPALLTSVSLSVLFIATALLFILFGGSIKAVWVMLLLPNVFKFTVMFLVSSIAAFSGKYLRNYNQSNVQG